MLVAHGTAVLHVCHMWLCVWRHGAAIRLVWRVCASHLVLEGRYVGRLAVHRKAGSKHGWGMRCLCTTRELLAVERRAIPLTAAVGCEVTV
jgi:hypothetical protein